jgi:hypothetical protein
MRLTVLATAAAALLIPAAIPAQAHHGNAIEHGEFAKATKKKKKAAKPKAKKEEYMRAVPSR